MPEPDSNVTLAIEAAGPSASVAVGRGHAMQHLEPVANAARHDDDLMPAIVRSFARIAASPKDLGTVLVSVGPGGFTGLRIAVSTVKMLALALNCRIVSVYETDAMIQAAPSANTPLAVCLTGKHGQYWTAFQHRGTAFPGQLLAIADVIHTAASEAITSIAVSQPPEHLADLAAAATAAGLHLIEVHPNASHVWQVGCRMVAAGRYTAAEQLLPIYPREPEAVRMWRQRKG